MKRFLKKKWHRIPVGIVLVVMALMLVAGSAFAIPNWYQVITGTAEVTINEAITISNPFDPGDGTYLDDDGDFSWEETNKVATWLVPAMYPGEMRFINLEITNLSSEGLSIRGTIHSTLPEGVTVTARNGESFTDPETLPSQVTAIWAIEIHAAGNVAPESFDIEFSLDRQSPI